MLNIEQELELSLTGYEIRSVRDTMYGDQPAIEVEIDRHGRHYDTWWFNAKTGVRFGCETMDEPVRLRPKSETRAINHFYLHAGYRDWPKEQWVKLAQEHFSEGGSAAERMKQHNGLASTHLSPFRFIVKKEVELSPVRDYPAWAEYRFASGEWEPAPWLNEPWAQTPETAHHFAHVSKADDSKIAYWETEANACIDSPSTMAPGRYLQRFYSDVLTANDIRDWAVKVDAEAVLKFAHTSDEIYEVYHEANGGPSSCMRYGDHKKCHDDVPWRSGINPVRAYAAGDLAVAYIERRGKIAGRALVWPDKKVAGRRYGDIERLEAALETAGYTFDARSNEAGTHGNGGFNGARLLKMPVEGQSGNYVMPYLDYYYKFNVEDDFIILQKDGGFYGHRTDGLAFAPTEDDDEDDENSFSCDACGSNGHIDNRFTIEGDDNWYCEGCYDNRTLSCDRCSDILPTHRLTTVNGDEDYCPACVDGHTNTCDYCYGRFDSDQIVPIHDARYENPADADVHSDACINCRDHEADNIQRDVNGVWIDTGTANCCEHCGNYFSGNLNEDECPVAACVDRRAEEGAAENTEMENA